MVRRRFCYACMSSVGFYMPVSEQYSNLAFYCVHCVEGETADIRSKWGQPSKPCSLTSFIIRKESGSGHTKWKGHYILVISDFEGRLHFFAGEVVCFFFFFWELDCYILTQILLDHHNLDLSEQTGEWGGSGHAHRRGECACAPDKTQLEEAPAIWKICNL